MTEGAYRPYEDLSFMHEASQNFLGDFEHDFVTFTGWCINNYINEHNHRENTGYSPESYGLHSSGNITKPSSFDLNAHVKKFIEPKREEWCWLYDLLEDFDSKNTLINILAYRCLGWRYVPMPLDNKDFWSTLEELESDTNKTLEDSLIDIGLFDTQLSNFNLEALGHKLNILASPNGIFTVILYSQYNYRGNDIKITPVDGDVVLDCGACFGATSLFLASQVGESGKVFSFEFFPKNIETFKQNLKSNKLFEKKITLIEAPVWSIDHVPMEVRGVGPATRVLLLNKGVRVERWCKKTLDTLLAALFPKYKKRYTSSYRFIVNAVSIDCEYQRQSMKSVDFIKMDIEGSELSALKGAKATILKHQPILAICVYHNLKDFYEIPKFISELKIGYQFYLQHSTVHGDETVLFAYVPNK